MRIVEINTVDYGSTGKIMLQLAEVAKKKGYDAYTFSRAWKQQKGIHGTHEYFGTYADNLVHRIVGPLSGYGECFSKKNTRYLLNQIDILQPDIIHIHNLHGWYINISFLFNYIKKKKIPIVWTLHDCWAFTGHCPHFTIVKCDKWKTGCYHCPQYKQYPETYIDTTEKMWKLKKKWFSGIDNMIIVTPSQWLADLVKQSYLKDYPVKVINNGINLDVFKATSSDFRKKYNISDEKFVLLGVAFGWGKRKGLDVFFELSKRLDNKKYQIVLVGTDANIDKQLPKNIISIYRTQNQRELAEIYTAADLFVNPTREENYPTVNMEAIACGTPVLTFKTGGSPEILDKKTGSVVDCDDIDAMEREIIRICNERPFSEKDCIKRSNEFDMNKRFKEYMWLYERGDN